MTHMQLLHDFDMFSWERAALGTCRLGAEDDRRPVAVAVWFHRQRTRVQGAPLAVHSAAAATTHSG